MSIPQAALILPALLILGSGIATAQTEQSSKSKFIEVDGVSLHYLDFGGEGMPIVFVHSEAWDAHTFADFGPRFTDRNRVLAVTRRGYGRSGGQGSGYDVPSQGEALIDFLDALAIDRAVVAGNASATSELTYLAEHHPERVAGLVYFTGLAVPWVDARESDPTRSFQMFRRANPGVEDAAERVRARSEYRPDFLRGDRPPIDVPALALVTRSGTTGHEHGIGALALVGSPLMSEVRAQMPPSPVRDHLDRLATDEVFRRQELEKIPDPVARSYFLRLAADDSLQAEVQRYHEEAIVSAVLAGQEQFRRAFGDNLRLARLDVSQVVGYEYRDSPELIEPHIRAFLDEIAGNPPTIHVAPPTGDRETDRASILAALEQVKPGGTVQFAPGTYLVGEIISVTVPRVTLLGHPMGTTLRGCNPDDMGTREYARVHCMGLELAGGNQTIRGFTFEYGHLALHLGCCRGERAMLRAPDGTLVEGPAIYRTEGGHLVEGNTFRRSANGIRMNGDWTEPAVVRGNRFIDNWHGVSINGNTVHLLDNDFAVPEPEQVPFYEFPNDAVKLGPTLPLQGVSDTLPRGCANNVVAGNRIDGSKNGISIMVWEPGTACRHNVIRDNTITVRRARVPSPENFSIVDESDSTFVGVPISLLNYPEAFGQNERGQHSTIEDNVIEGNRIIGAEGIGIEILYASRNRIVNNTITGIAVRTPFPGNTMGSEPERWRDWNGSGIWISPGSDGNEIVGNTFEDVASHAVVIEGDLNRVETRSASDAVRDLGNGNRVSRSDSVQTRIIEVDGHAVHVFTAGWEHLKRGQPVVVFEAGGFSTLDAWGDLPARLAQETAVVAYDRAGRGRSEWDGQRPTLEHVTSRLRRILEVLDAPPPYIHVGHSFGGPLGLAFAREYPDELAGLVLVDPTPPAADWLGAFDDIGIGRAGHDEFIELFSRAFEGAPESLLIEFDVLSGYLSDPDGSPWSPPDLSVPVAVLLAGAGYEVPPDLPSTFDLDQQHQALLLRQIANYAEWTRTVPDATMIVANNSRHCIHCWDPELVIGAIRRVLYSDVRVQLRQAMAAEGISSIEPTYNALRSRYPDSHFDESRLELLGRELLGFGESEAAIAVFELNAREYPDVVRPHESLGDAYRAASRLEDARDSYERASQLAEANASARLPALRRKLEGIEREQQRSQSDSSQDNDRR